MDIKDIKKEWNAKILDILKALTRICEDHGLTFYCCAGTAIGAVRHHGIIPWDDDIDVIMPRPDYDRLLEIAKKEDFGKYELVTPYDNEAYPLYFSKLSDKTTTLVEERERPCVIGLFVDIFPLDATDDEMYAALDKSCAQFVRELPQGLDTLCSEQGGGLSEGQAQRIAIARALLRDRQVMLFDEATSALDPETERQLLQNILSSHEKTVIFITHRPAVVDYCDQTLTLCRQ